MRALGHPVRLSILRILAEQASGDCCCTDVIQCLPLAQPLPSLADYRSHLRVLEAWLQRLACIDPAPPALTDALLTRRNANWARWIEGRMAQPGTVMVAVGAGHLAGPASVQAMLGKRGLKVTRLQ